MEKGIGISFKLSNFVERLAPAEMAGKVYGEVGEESWQQVMRENIIKEVGLNADQADRIMKIVVESFKVQVVREAKKVALKTVQDDCELRKSANSIIIHRVDQWINEEFCPPELNSAVKTTMAFHQMTRGAAAILDAFVLGWWDGQAPPTAVLVTFGSCSQKTTFFKMLAKCVGADHKLRSISCWGAFPKRLIEAARKGSALKARGEVGAFRVAAWDPGCVPVLDEVLEGGRREERWRVYNEGLT